MNRRNLLRAALAASMACNLPRASAQATRIEIKFALNRAPYDASNAPFLLAREKGYFAQEGFDVTFSLSKNASDAIRRVATNEFDFGFVDGSVNLRAAMQGKGPAPVYLFAIFDRSPACIVTWKASGIDKPADLAGKSIIATPGDGAFQMFQPFLRAAGIAPGAVKIIEAGLEDREASMFRRLGDGAIGFDTTIFYKLRDMGTKLEELNFMYYADGGLELYSNGIVVSQRMLREQRDRNRGGALRMDPRAPGPDGAGAREWPRRGRSRAATPPGHANRGPGCGREGLPGRAGLRRELPAGTRGPRGVTTHRPFAYQRGRPH